MFHSNLTSTLQVQCCTSCATEHVFHIRKAVYKELVMMQTSTCISLQIMSYGTSVLRSYNVELCKMCENKLFDNLCKGTKVVSVCLVFI